MECEICEKKIFVNYADAYSTLCSECYNSEKGKSYCIQKKKDENNKDVIPSKSSELHSNKNMSSSKSILFSIYGALLGIPISYYFQPEMVRAKMGNVFKYMEHFDEIVNSSELFPNVIISVIVFAIIGGVIGYFVDKNNVNKNIKSN